ncbi:MAG: hypothetical protein WBQ89_04790 [Candidatus Acidiferrum sp.]
MATTWAKRFESLRDLGILALFGIAPAIIGACCLTSSPIRTTLIVTGLLLGVPALIYLNLVTIWHWKSRYRGKHSDLWGALILVETSGWFKVVYLVRHIIPDARQSGRYATSTPLALIDAPTDDVVDNK